MHIPHNFEVYTVIIACPVEYNIEIKMEWVHRSNILMKYDYFFKDSKIDDYYTLAFDKFEEALGIY